VKNQVQLITYVDRLGAGGLRELHRLLTGPLAGLFGSVHLLPFFHAIDGADAGFDPIDHTLVDPRLGSWSDVHALSRDVPVMADLIVNHMSVESPQFLDFSRRGAESDYDGLFLTLGSVFPHGATERDLLTLFRPRPGLPFTYSTLKNGEKRILWTTFTPQQIDIDVRHPKGRSYLDAILQTFRASGVTMIRLDAAGYAIKQPGTSCFMIPETYEFIAELSARARSLGIETLVEIHSYYRQQIEIARHVDRVYDFALPPLVLHALFNDTARALKAWLAISPRNAITVLDTHDGIGIVDVGADSADRVGKPGLLSAPELDALVETIHARSDGQSRLATGAAANNLDLYQVNCTYYDALGRNERDYLIARAIQFFAPGVPQVYYVGLLAGANDLELLQRTAVGRDINRHYFTANEVADAASRPVVRDLFELIRLRNSHAAFDGEFSIVDSPDAVLCLRWTHANDWIELTVDLPRREAEIRYTQSSEIKTHPLFAHTAVII
jgi:sucrose phosphorylase